MLHRVLAPWIVVATILLALGGCNQAANVDVVEEEVVRFRQLLDATQFDVIYQESSDEMKESTKQEDLVRLLDALHRKLGTSKSAERQHMGVAYITNGTFVTMVYNTSYTEGPATEHFVYRMDGDMPKLYSFHVNSPLFLK